MKTKKRTTCELCGREIAIINGGVNQTERLCLHCLIAAYPVLKPLIKVV